MSRWPFLPFLFAFCIQAQEPSPSLYASLDPTSVSQHLAFYELYSDTPLGKQALTHAWSLLQGKGEQVFISLPSIDLQPILSLINRGSEPLVLKEEQLTCIEQLGASLANRRLKGHSVWDKESLLSLPLEEIDLARGLLLTEMQENSPSMRETMRSYEAMIDLMALQILARLPLNPTPKQVIRAMNDYIFGELCFRFPPHSLWAKEIDIYTLLPAVLDQRKGVCLGVSILYLCLAQRLDLPLEMITPPGHAYVRYVDPETNEITNIETTARGLNTPSEMYLGIETLQLPKKTIREVLGLALINRASVSWHREDVQETISFYQQALLYLPDDYLVQLLLAYSFLFAGEIEQGTALLKSLQTKIPEGAIAGDSIAEDYLQGKTDVKAIQTVYREVNETRKSILEKQKEIEETIKRCPEFRQGYLHLAVTWLQLGRAKEALPLLERYHAFSPQDPVGSYYLAAIHFQRLNFIQAWKFTQKTEELLKTYNHYPQSIKELRQALEKAFPEPEKPLLSCK